MSSGDTVVKITEKTYCSTADEDSIFAFFIDGQLQYHCFSAELAKEFLEDLVRDLEVKFKKLNPEYRVFIEKQNDWTYFIQRARDGIMFRGKPKQTHIVEIKRSQKLLKPIPTK